MDDKTANESKALLGHNGPVYATHFSRDRKYLLSCSEDATSMYDICLTSVCFFVVFFLCENLKCMDCSIKNSVFHAYCYANVGKISYYIA